MANEAEKHSPNGDAHPPSFASSHHPQFVGSAAYAANRKVDPSKKSGLKPDGTPNDNDRVEIGPTPLAFAEWEAAGLTAPNLTRMRQFRLNRIVASLNERDLAGVLVFDPLNIRYASDTTNMQLWNTHNAFRACLVMADSYMIVWDYKSGGLLTNYNPLVRECRGGASFFYFSSGDLVDDDAHSFAKELSQTLEEHCGTNKRIAVDKIMIHGLRALEREGFEVLDGEEFMEKTRAVKGIDEINAMRCAVHACEMSIHEMQRQAVAGMTENDIWAILHAENIKRGGEWIETRILSSGPRTNPWYQESGPRVIQNNEVLAFDTDLVGCYGMCVDISRTWWIGDAEPPAELKRLYTEAYLQISQNAEVLGPGVPFKDITFKGRELPEEFAHNRYSCKMHGVGVCDEWPAIYYPQDYRENMVNYQLEPGMMLCSEAYIGTKGGAYGVKLEDQFLITDDGYENLTKYPFETNLLNI